MTDDPNYTILKDLASKCGLGGSTSDITVDYTIKVRLRFDSLQLAHSLDGQIGVRFLFINVSPSISNSYSFACPIDTSNSGDLEVRW